MSQVKELLCLSLLGLFFGLAKWLFESRLISYLLCELLLLMFWVLRVLTRNAQTDSAKARSECTQNVSGTVVAPEVDGL